MEEVERDLKDHKDEPRAVAAGKIERALQIRP